MSKAFCSDPSCDRPVVSRGMCSMHYNRFNLASKPSNAPCSIDGCDKPWLARGLCPKHYQQLWKTGDPVPRLRAPAGSGHVSKAGYREVWVDGRMRREHRVVMEQRLGRDLRDDEQIHHRNGNRLDNRLENLELWTTSHPYGQRVEDQLAWARELLARYEDTVLACP